MLQSIKNISSYVQCKWLNVWSAYFYFNTLSCQNYFFQGVWEFTKSSGNSEGAAVILVAKTWKFRGGGRAYVKFPPWWGNGYFLELTQFRSNSPLCCQFRRLNAPPALGLQRGANPPPSRHVKATVQNFFPCTNIHIL